MLKFNRKQWILVIGCFVAAAILNWLIWFISMGKPGEISGLYHVLNTVCLAAALIAVGDRFAKTQIFR